MKYKWICICMNVCILFRKTHRKIKFTKNCDGFFLGCATHTHTHSCRYNMWTVMTMGVSIDTRKRKKIALKCSALHKIYLLWRSHGHQQQEKLHSVNILHMRSKHTQYWTTTTTTKRNIKTVARWLYFCFRLLPLLLLRFLFFIVHLLTWFLLLFFSLML